MCIINHNFYSVSDTVPIWPVAITAGQQKLLFPLQVKQFHEASLSVIFLYYNNE